MSDEETRADILVVDDTLANLRLLSSMLRGQGYKVRSVPDGNMALTAARSALPDLILLDINMPAEGIFHNLVIVSIKKEYRGHARKVMYALWGLGLLALAKTIVVVDADVNVQDPSEVAWRVTANINPATDIVMVDGPLDDLDVASPTYRHGSKMGIDPTAKGPMDGFPREWPDDVVMSDEVKALVDGRWAEYGLR